MWLKLLYNSLSTNCRLGYDGVWIRSPPFLQWVKEPLPLHYVKLHRFSVYSSDSFTTSWSHHLIIWIVLASGPPWYRVPKWGGMPPVPLWLPDVSKCTHVWVVVPCLLMPPPPGDILTPRLPHVSPSSPWSIWLPDGETSPGPSMYPLSPTNSRCRTAELTVPLPYTSYHSPKPLLPYLSTPPKSPPTISIPS